MLELTKMFMNTMQVVVNASTEGQSVGSTTGFVGQAFPLLVPQPHLFHECLAEQCFQYAGGSECQHMNYTCFNPPKTFVNAMQVVMNASTEGQSVGSTTGFVGQAFPLLLP